MKTFQSYEAKLYCKSHVPKAPARGVVADSAEMTRIKGVTNKISNLQYKKEYEKNKGDGSGFSQSAIDAPEIKNSMKAGVQASNIK